MRPPSLPPAAILAADRPHGTRIKYVAGCHCVECRAANNAYEKHWSKLRQTGRGNGLVSAAQARRHLEKLSRLGVGRRSVAAASDVPESTLLKIRTGKRRQIRRHTERRILAITIEAAGDRSLIDAAPTWRLIRDLLREGFTKRELARRLGKGISLQLGKTRITAANANKVERVYSQVMN